MRRNNGRVEERREEARHKHKEEHVRRGDKRKPEDMPQEECREHKSIAVEEGEQRVTEDETGGEDIDMGADMSAINNKMRSEDKQSWPWE